MKIYTNEQLKRVLAKLASNQVHVCELQHMKGKLRWNYDECLVDDRCLPQIVWDIEKTMTEEQWANYWSVFHAASKGSERFKLIRHKTWQQCTVALAQVFGIEIV